MATKAAPSDAPWSKQPCGPRRTPPPPFFPPLSNLCVTRGGSVCLLAPLCFEATKAIQGANTPCPAHVKGRQRRATCAMAHAAVPQVLGACSGRSGHQPRHRHITRVSYDHTGQRLLASYSHDSIYAFRCACARASWVGRGSCHWSAPLLCFGSPCEP